MNQVEFLLRLSENAQDKGDDIARRHNVERASYIKELLELDRMIDLAKQNVLSELFRFGHAPPQQGQLPPNKPTREEHQPMPRIVQKGPAVG